MCHPMRMIFKSNFKLQVLPWNPCPMACSLRMQTILLHPPTTAFIQSLQRLWQNFHIFLYRKRLPNSYIKNMRETVTKLNGLAHFAISGRPVMSTGHAGRLCQSSPETKPKERQHSGNKTMKNGWTWNNNIR